MTLKGNASLMWGSNLWALLSLPFLLQRSTLNVFIELFTGNVRGCDSSENNGVGNSLASHKQRLVQDEPLRSQARDPERAGLALWRELRPESSLFLSQLV